MHKPTQGKQEIPFDDGNYQPVQNFEPHWSCATCLQPCLTQGQSLLPKAFPGCLLTNHY